MRYYHPFWQTRNQTQRGDVLPKVTEPVRMVDLSVVASLSCLSCVLSGWSGVSVSEVHMYVCTYTG